MEVKYFNADGTESIVEISDDPGMIPLVGPLPEDGHDGFALAVILGSMAIGAACIVGTVWAVMSNLNL